MFNASAIIASSYLPWEENRKKKKSFKGRPAARKRRL